jgi:hypothetical protein
MKWRRNQNVWTSYNPAGYMIYIGEHNSFMPCNNSGRAKSPNRASLTTTAFTSFLLAEYICIMHDLLAQCEEN